MAGPPRSVLGGAVPFDVCSALPLLRTSHLWRNMNSNAGLISVDAAVRFTRLPSPITADHYRYNGCIGIGGDTQTELVPWAGRFRC